MVEMLGVGNGAATVEDMENSELIFIFGKNALEQTTREC